MGSKSIRIYCNFVLGGWKPERYYDWLAGGERSICGLARELTKAGHNVTVYANTNTREWEGVQFRKREEFEGWEYSDIFISWKDRDIWNQTIEAGKKFLYTSEIFDFGFIPAEIVAISPYHANRLAEEMPSIEGRVMVIPCGTEDIPVGHGKHIQALYSSAPERGMNSIVEKWTKDFPKLVTTYGWESFELYNSHNTENMRWRDSIRSKLDAVSAKQVKASRSLMDLLYQESKYWIHPVEQADSELFCLSAVEAQLAGCMPVIRRNGALKTTVLHALDWDTWTGTEELTDKQLAENRKHAEQFLWQNNIKLWEQKWKSE